MRVIIHFNFRWNRAKGATIDSNDENWYTGEPDITGFNYNIRETSPITNESFQECSSTPTYECSVSNMFSCDQTPDDTLTKTPSFTVTDAVTGTMCQDSTGDACKGAINSLFVSFDVVKATTNDATPACMAMLGPNVNDEAIKGTDYDQCGLLFDFEREDGAGVESYDYAKWIDLKCNQRSRSLMCSTLGMVVMMNSFIRYEKPKLSNVNSTDIY